MPRRKTAAGKPGPRPTSARRPALEPLAAQVRRLRLARDLTQERLAELADINPKYPGRVELARADPSASLVVRLARALAVSVAELFGSTSETRPLSVLTRADAQALLAKHAALTTVIDRSGRVGETHRRPRGPLVAPGADDWPGHTGLSRSGASLTVASLDAFL